MEEIFARQIKVVLTALLWTAVYLGPLAFAALLYVLLSLSLRRRERARLFLDLIEMGLVDGHTPERTIVAASGSRDMTPGVRFHLLAAYIQTGLRLDQALEKVPRLLPAQIVAMFKVGYELADVRRVLPACRMLLNDAFSQTRGASHYLILLAFVVLPAMPLAMLVSAAFTQPRFNAIAADLGVDSASPWLLSNGAWLWGGYVLVTFTCQALLILHLGGPRLQLWLARSKWLCGLNRFTDALAWRIPWRRKRLLRDFGMMLGLLLDAGVAEERALLLAGESTSNHVMIHATRRAALGLRDGRKLTDVVARLDRSGEFQWRLHHARHEQRGLVPALRGWFEALDAKAFQQEQAAAHVTTALLVVLNGTLVGAFIISMFSVLTTIINHALLW